eukprot:5283491-Karenia_brevis.AAC.1
MAGMIDQILRHGFRPPEMWHDPVVWRDRSWNKQADYIANRVMDTSQSYRYVYDGVKIRAQTGNIIIFSDGGLRRASPGRKVAAAAWAAYLEERGCFTLVAFEGKMLETRSAFEAEVVALDLALQFMSMI